MMIRTVIFSLVFVTVNAQCPDVPSTGCSVCGLGQCVQAPDAVFEFPDQPTTPCGTLEMAGLTGMIPLSQCPFLPGLVSVCECGVPSVEETPAPAVSTPPPVETTAAPVIEPTAAPVESTAEPVPVKFTHAPVNQLSAPVDEPTIVLGGSCPDIPEGGCSVCGPDRCVQNPDGVFMYPGQPTVPCGTLELAGSAGMIPLDQCPFLVPIVSVCACGTPAEPTPAPIQSPAATTTSCPDVPSSGCSVCGPGLCVQAPDAVFEFPDQPTTPCGTLEMAGLTGMIPLSQCPFLPGIVSVCECGVPSVEETPTPAVSTPPPIEPTTSPVIEPTAAPVESTGAPVNPTATTVDSEDSEDSEATTGMKQKKKKSGKMMMMQKKTGVAMNKADKKIRRALVVPSRIAKQHRIRGE